VRDRHPALAWLLAWLLPGAGHLYLGQRARGLALGGALVGCFVAGVLVGGRSTVSLHHPEYVVLQAGAGLPAAVAFAASTPEPQDVPVPRRELGVLYTLVAALLNLVVAVDAAARAVGADPGGPPPAGEGGAAPAAAAPPPLPPPPPPPPPPEGGPAP
jgi:hypothetical protein